MILIKYRDEQGRGGGGVKNREMVNVRARKVFDKFQIYDNILGSILSDQLSLD